MLEWILGTFFISYVLGSMPFGLLITRLGGTADIRKIGSGNIGATNVMRTGRKGLALLTLLLDGGKGALAVIVVTKIYNPYYGIFAGLIAILAHIFPVWLKFKGGKGVSTTLGVFFAIDWRLGLCVVAMWLIVFAFTRIASLASMMSIGYSAIAAYLLTGTSVTLFCLAAAAITLFAHRTNISRLMEGTEGTFRKGAV